MSLHLHTWLCQDAELPCCCRVAWCVARRTPLIPKALCEVGLLVFNGFKGKNWKKKKRKAGGKEGFLADPKMKCNFFFTKVPSVWLSYCSKHRKNWISAVNNSEVTQFNAWVKQTLESTFSQGKATSPETSLVICSFIIPKLWCAKAKSPLIFEMAPPLPICCCGQAKDMHRPLGKQNQVLPHTEQHLASEQDTASLFSWATRSDRESRKGQNGKTKDLH